MMRWLLSLAIAFNTCAAIAQQANVRDAERLSEWLLRQDPPPAYPIALSWQVPQEQAAQQDLKARLLTLIKESQVPQASELLAWVQRQKVTGRVLLPSVDPRWLQVRPALDPKLNSDQLIKMFPRPTTVRVLLGSGRICFVPQQAGLTAKVYAQACASNAGSVAWIAQPDGRVSQAGIATWNAEPQSELAPGAWIWAPAASENYPLALSEGLIRFLAALDLPADASVASSLRDNMYALQPVAPALLRSQPLSASDWGEIGLLQTPTARMQGAGSFRAHISKVQPYTRTNIMFQPLDWLETGFRYSDISNQAYDASGTLQTDQSYKDKSLDVKLRLKQESDFWPAVALGIRDIGGTGFFSSEYLVANKRLGDVDFSLGIGWGNMGSSGNIKNPLSNLSSKFEVRPSATTASGGEVGGKAFFRGPAALFGGVQWRATDQWLLKLEREGNDYQSESLGNVQKVKSAWNLGATYRYSPITDLSFGLERGRQLMLGVTFNADLDGLHVPKLLNPPMLKYQAAPDVALADISKLVGDGLVAQTGWTLVDLEEAGSFWRLRISMGAGSGSNSHRQERLDRLNALLQSLAPAHIKRWQITFTERGLPLHAVEVDRDAWRTSQTQFAPLSLKRETVLAFAPPDRPSTALSDPRATSTTRVPQAPASAIRLGPSYSQVLGGPDAFLLYRIGAEISASYQFDESTWLDGSVDLRLADNMAGFKYTAPSNLPRVRTNLREYTTTSRVTMPVLQATHVRSLAADHFGSVYAGYLESMFAGAGAEWLYRPWQSRLAIGADINFVKQRSFEQNFALREYQTSTGHITAYWDTGFANTLAKLQVGKYLAGDIGATLDVSRRFSNGAAMGVYATKTNVSAEQFGEGSFDKGIYFTLPFDVMLPKYSDRTATITWQPLTRDGGARLQRQQQLYNMTAGRDRQAFTYASSESASQVKTRQDNELKALHVPESLAVHSGSEAPIASAAHKVLTTAVQTAQELTHPDSVQPWARGLGLVLASSALDDKANRWALNHTNLGSIAKLGNSVPLILGLGALADLGANGVGATALQSAGFAYATNAVIRVGFGRARPREEQGNGHFDAFTAQGLKSSFASNHTAVAFALATPFAQAYDMPWLYGLASLTALGRVQAREHWLSDTVAGGVLGYAIGSVMFDQHSKNAAQQSHGRQLLISPTGVAAKWWWQ